MDARTGFSPNPCCNSWRTFRKKWVKKSPEHHHANLCPLIPLEWPSMHLHILMRKLTFLLRLMCPDNSSISTKVFPLLRKVDLNHCMLVAQQCRLLEQGYNTNFASILLDEESALDIKSVFKLLEQADQKYIRIVVDKKPSLQILSQPIRWTKLWDIACDHGIQCSRSISLAVLTTLTTPTFTDRECPHCNNYYHNKRPAFCRAPCPEHLSVSIINMLKDENKAIFSIARD